MNEELHWDDENGKSTCIIYHYNSDDQTPNQQRTIELKSEESNILVFVFTLLLVLCFLLTLLNFLLLISVMNKIELQLVDISSYHPICNRSNIARIVAKELADKHEGMMQLFGKYFSKIKTCFFKLLQIS